MTKASADLTPVLVKHFDTLLNGQAAPDLPDAFSEYAEVIKMHEAMLKLRAGIQDFANGDLSHSIAFSGYSAGCLKALQAHLRHLVWQVQQVAAGDFSQRVEFLGDFSTSFNSMIIQLDTVLTELRKKEEDLLSLTRNLKQEVELRKSAMHALSQSEAKYRYLAEHDPLTDSLNRRSFFAHSITILKNAVLAKEPCCIAIMDLDKFKSVNDTYGHAVGDLALKHSVKIANSCLRSADIMGRFGGEEFIFLFAAANLENGAKAAERIRSAIKATPLPLENGKELIITVSMGVSVVMPEWPGERTDSYLVNMINAADFAMYEAKQTGRDKVITAKAEEPTSIQNG